MSKRNIILITIVLVIIIAVALVFMSFYKPTSKLGSESTGTNFLSEFFPFGKSTTTPGEESTPPVDISGYTPPTTPEAQRELLTKVSSMPIAGYGVFMKERFKEGDTATEFAPSLRYAERATGNVYQTFADKIDERKFTTTVVPQVYDAYFGNKGNSVIMRYLKGDGNTIEGFAGVIPKETLGGDTAVSNEITGSFLPENIKDISLSPDSLSVFYLFNTENNAIGVTATSSGERKNQIFNSSFTEWLSGWPNARMITLTTKPSFNSPGFMYSLDPGIKKMNKILGDIKGLTTLTSPSGKLILYNNNNLALRIYNVDTEESMSLGIKTMPEKCVWDSGSVLLYCAVPKNVSGANYPDIWYQGEISFSDDLWKINVENGSAVNIADPISFTRGEEIDGIKLSLDEGENYLFFVNKKDSYLWELNLK